MFMRVVNHVNLQMAVFQGASGERKTRDLLSRNNPKAEWQTVNLVNLVNLHVNLAIVHNPQCSRGLLTC